MPHSSTRFTSEQLKRLEEIPSALDCECPRQLSKLVSGLIAFEEYSAKCALVDSKDLVMHETLHERTLAARKLMEDTLSELLRYERIVL